GVTRDRIFAEVEWLDKYFTLVDTGGIEPDSEDIILSQMRNQAMLAMDMSHVILFIVDGKAGITAADKEIAQLLRKTKKPVILVVNKIDSQSQFDNIYDFYELGFGTPFAVSGANSMGFGDLLDEIVENFPAGLDTEYEEDIIRVAITGKPNAGKSSILNKILGEERVIVSPIAGTTRDAIDTYFEKNGQKFLLIDTAGLRRKSKIYETIEKYSVIRAMSAVDRADVVLIVIDALEGVTEQDTKVAGIAHDEGKGCIFVINKWDLIEKDNKTMSNYTKDIKEKFPFMMYAPIVFVSAKTNQRMNKILDTVEYVSNEHSKRISTSALNEVIGEAVMLNQPPSDKGRRLKIYYGTQTDIRPPKITLFINDKDLTHFSYQRYLENKIRENFGFEGTSIKFEYRQKNKK
ncbi:TPA: ribosome biogenesis GTPase Der, partial [Clostridioides difficile]|nr:ribosome biogenesis GTPase Der [Clostridioides difficile]